MSLGVNNKKYNNFKKPNTYTEPKTDDPQHHEIQTRSSIDSFKKKSYFFSFKYLNFFSSQVLKRKAKISKDIRCFYIL